MRGRLVPWRDSFSRGLLTLPSLFSPDEQFPFFLFYLQKKTFGKRFFLSFFLFSLASFNDARPTRRSFPFGVYVTNRRIHTRTHKPVESSSISFDRYITIIRSMNTGLSVPFGSLNRSNRETLVNHITLPLRPFSLSRKSRTSRAMSLPPFHLTKSTVLSFFFFFCFRYLAWNFASFRTPKFFRRSTTRNNSFFSCSCFSFSPLPLHSSVGGYAR